MYYVCFAQMVEYVVLDIEPVRGAPSHGKFQMAEAQVARVSDFGRNDTVFFTKTHLGNLLHPGDTALGFDLTSAQVWKECGRWRLLFDCGVYTDGRNCRACHGSNGLVVASYPLLSYTLIRRKMH